MSSYSVKVFLVHLVSVAAAASTAAATTADFPAIAWTHSSDHHHSTTISYTLHPTPPHPLLTVNIPPAHVEFHGTYALVTYPDVATAELAIATYSGKQQPLEFYSVTFTLQWPEDPNQLQQMMNRRRPRRPYRTDETHLWVGDLAVEVDESMLMQAFSQFPSITDTRVMCDIATGRSRGYGFVSFGSKEEAEQAVIAMAGQQIGGKPIRINWARQRAHQNDLMMAPGRPPLPTSMSFQSAGGYPMGGHPHYRDSNYRDHRRSPRPPSHATSPRGPLEYDAVLAETPDKYSTIYVGQIPTTVSSDDLLQSFGQQGTIVDSKLHIDRGFAFLRFDTHESAAKAITYGHGLAFHGSTLRCAWGRNNPRKSPIFGHASASMGSFHPGHMHPGQPTLHPGYLQHPLAGPHTRHMDPYFLHQQQQQQQYLYFQQMQQGMAGMSLSGAGYPASGESFPYGGEQNGSNAGDSSRSSTGENGAPQAGGVEPMPHGMMYPGAFYNPYYPGYGGGQVPPYGGYPGATPASPGQQQQQQHQLQHSYMMYGAPYDPSLVYPPPPLPMAPTSSQDGAQKEEQE